MLRCRAGLVSNVAVQCGDLSGNPRLPLHICVGSVKDKASHTSAEDSWRHHEFADPTFTSLMLSCFQIALNRLCAPLSRISSSKRNLRMHSSHGPAPDPAKAKDHGKPTGSITTLIADAAPCTTISPAAAAASTATSMPVPVPSPRYEASTPTRRCSPRHRVVRSSRWPAGCTSGGPQSFTTSNADVNSSRDSHYCRSLACPGPIPAGSCRPTLRHNTALLHKTVLCSSLPDRVRQGWRKGVPASRPTILPRRRRISVHGSHQQYECASDCAAELSPLNGPTSQRASGVVRHPSAAPGVRCAECLRRAKASAGGDVLVAVQVHEPITVVVQRPAILHVRISDQPCVSFPSAKASNMQ